MDGNTAILAGVITADMLNGVLNEIVALIPIGLPVAVSLLAVRKGYSWIMGMLHSA